MTEAELLALIAIRVDPKDLPRYRHAARKAFHIMETVALRNADAARFACEALNKSVFSRPCGRFGMQSKGSFNNFIRTCRALLVLAGECDEKVDLTQEWQTLYDRLPTRERQMGFVSFCQFGTLSGLSPNMLADDALDKYATWCLTRQLKRDIPGLVRRTASGWNWAAEHLNAQAMVRLSQPAMRDHYTFHLADYPASFQDELNTLLTDLATDPRERMFTQGMFKKSASKSPRSRPHAASARTITTKLSHALGAGAALVLGGIPIDSITSLRDLVSPQSRVDMIVKFHLRRRLKHEAEQRFETRPAHLIGIVDFLRQIATFRCGLSDEEVAHISDFKSQLNANVQIEMTEKNRHRLRALLAPNVYAKMLHLPQHLMRRAKDIWTAAKEETGRSDLPPPLEAARLAMYAAGLEIALFAPLRRSNLVSLNLKTSFVRDEQTGVFQRLLVPSGLTKNKEPIDWAMPDEAAKLLRVYVRHYRPVLAHPDNPYLFPGLGLTWRNESEFGTRVAKLVEHEVGAEFNMHLARHFSVVRYLRAYPGQYAVVSRLLGHKKVETTMRFYAGLEVDAAATQANELLKAERSQTRAAAAASFRSRSRSSSSGKRAKK